MRKQQQVKKKWMKVNNKVIVSYDIMCENKTT